VCFSSGASLATGVLLLPVGAYSITAALRKNRRYLPLAVTPALFGIQQLCEAGVWLGIGWDDAALIKNGSLAFLFFAIAFWPFWIPLAAAVLELRPARRMLFLGLAAFGLACGFAFYLPGALHYDEWLSVAIVGHSIQYDLSGVPIAQAIAVLVWQVVYLSLVCLPLLLSREPRLRALGVSVAIAAVITHVAFRYAFASVWCFFAAILSIHICFVLYRLPTPDGDDHGRMAGRL
jgi:Family of unknown function (DUF6629)